MTIISGPKHGQVLQRRGRSASINIEGTCDGSGTVHARLSQGGKALPGWASRTIGRAIEGKFRARLAQVPVGGPYELKLWIGTDKLTVGSIFAGDVWLLAGQSNMAGAGDLD